MTLDELERLIKQTEGKATVADAAKLKRLYDDIDRYVDAGAQRSAGYTFAVACQLIDEIKAR